MPHAGVRIDSGLATGPESGHAEADKLPKAAKAVSRLWPSLASPVHGGFVSRDTPLSASV